MSDRYLLYIDLLGFSDMTIRDPRKVARLYSIIDSLNAHQHEVFKTIVFSDTILVYNIVEPINDEDRKYLVWYLIEFAEDLHHRLTGQDIYFRGVVRSGDFDHYQLKNIQCFYGGALVSSYLAEKDIDCAGLFLDKSCAQFNEFFRTAKYNSDLSFIYLNRHLERINESAGGVYPSLHQTSDDAPFAPHQVRYLKDVYKSMRSHPSPRARIKLLSAWDFHAMRYPQMLDALVRSNFDIHALTPHTDWSESIDSMQRSIKFYKRIGAGTSHSVKIGRSPRKHVKA